MFVSGDLFVGHENTEEDGRSEALPQRRDSTAASGPSMLRCGIAAHLAKPGVQPGAEPCVGGEARQRRAGVCIFSERRGSAARCQLTAQFFSK
ncbi:MAG: hypothetical protein M5U15_08435 [Kiritimatiellae bacterium]|nr:hypothetical protein [Kiritimatiellia bacterium]